MPVLSSGGLAGAGLQGRRLGRLGRGLLCTTPGHAVAYCVLFVFSQTFLLAALLLPWKLLTMMVTDTMPSFVPQVWDMMSVREVVLALAVGALGALLCFGATELAMARVASHGSRDVLERNDKVVLFEGYGQHAVALYRQFLRGLAAAVVVLLILLVLAFLYPLVCGSLLFYLIWGGVLVRWRAGRKKASADLALTPGLSGTAWWVGGGIFVMTLVVWDHWYERLPSWMVVFACLLLARQVLVLSAVVYSAGDLFARQAHKAEALFLRNTTWKPVRRAVSDFMAMAEPERRQVWLREVLAPWLPSCDVMVTVTECAPSDQAQILLFVVRVELESRLPSAFFVKIFNTTRQDRAQHEQDVLRHAQAHWPAPHLLATEQVQGFSCLVYAWDFEAVLLSGPVRTAGFAEVRDALLACEPPNDLLARYGRSRPHLAERLAEVNWSELACVVMPGQDDGCQKLQELWPRLLDCVRHLPGQVMISGLPSYRLDRVCGKLLVRNWAHWVWEPVGAGWPVRTTDAQFEAALSKARTSRPALKAVGVHQVRLAALVFEFDRLWRKHDYMPLMQLIPALLLVARRFDSQ